MRAPRRRLPVRLRRNGRPLAALLAGLAVLLVFFGDARVTPLVTSASDAEGDVVTDDIAGAVDLFDETVAHTIQVEFDEDDYRRMAEQFDEDGTKEYIEADVTIDGTFVPGVGLRLKGNSTLQSLGGGGGAGPQQAEDGRMGGGGFGGTGVRLSFDEPGELPWLISLDEYAEGRAYQGLRELAVRPGGDGEVPLNEAVSLGLMAASGQPSERYTFSSFTVNNEPAVTRLVVENPGAGYAADELGTNGVLYKARAGSSFTYRGDDPTAYEDDFAQLTKKGSQDLQPVIDLIRWAEEASDEEFAAELGDHVDLASFAAYTATQNLLLNADDMAGPGSNYLLWYDLGTHRFTVLGWDFNLALSGDATTGPDEESGMGGGGPPGGGRAQDGGRQQEGGQQPPEGMEPPDGMEAPEGMEPPEGMQPPGGGTGEGTGADAGGLGRMGGNTLKERFLELDAFTDAYHAAYRDLYERFYASGTALDLLDSLVARATAAGADADALGTAADRLRETVTARTEALAGEEAVTG